MIDEDEDGEYEDDGGYEKSETALSFRLIKGFLDKSLASLDEPPNQPPHSILGKIARKKLKQIGSDRNTNPGTIPAPKNDGRD